MPLHFSSAWRIAVTSRFAVIDCVMMSVSTTLCQVFLHLSLVFFQIWSMAESHYKAFQ